MAKPRVYSEETKQKMADYKKQHTHVYALSVNDTTDPEMYNWLKSIKNIPEYFRGLIRKDMEENRKS